MIGHINVNKKSNKGTVIWILTKNGEMLGKWTEKYTGKIKCGSDMLKKEN